ncbi:MAG: Unknown protein [uncultured Sulfurovum sp.]|uniref:Cytochrome C n=1 Tax=uncultured Sulfurovum sp. TaxID=269237 RepID=A0A6S6S6V1_9BACT|nr:MAG: Unknown protein [uncultured Sulfurovum sp.]
MKKILLMSIVAGGLLFAEGVVNRENIKVMQDLETSIAVIQKGFFYNNEGIVANGVNDVKALMKNIDAFKIQNEDDLKFDSHKYAKDESESISLLADTLLTQFKDGKKDDSTRTYSTILNKCIACHKIIRKW